MKEEDILYLTKKEQMDLMVDPICLEIISIIGEEEYFTPEWLAKQLNHKKSIIEEYMELMLKNGFIDQIEDKSTKDKKVYCKAVKSIRACKILFTEEMDTTWISGYINFLENSLIEFFDKLGEVDGDQREYLENIGFSREIFSDYSKVYLSPDEVEELFEYIGNFVTEKSSRERKKDDKFKEYHMFNFIFPHLLNKKED